ncbi:hypothetical protein K402DRAFT_305304, partial [Aulographum hederae CBS 113979]
QRDWKETTPKDIFAYLGVLIWAGIHHKTALKQLWATDQTHHPVHKPVRASIGLKRWQQIDRFFHIQFPGTTVHPGLPEDKLGMFAKMEPLNEHLRAQAKQLWVPGRSLSVDEAMEPFSGRAKETLLMSTKPVPEGFKLWVLADHGYAIDWLFHAKGTGPIDLDDFWYNPIHLQGPQLSKTQSVVLDLAVQSLP